jgi:uncharacterized protein
MGREAMSVAHDARDAHAFDAYAVARSRQRIEGSVDAAQLERAGEHVGAPAQPGGCIRYTIAGTADEGGRPALAVILDGTIRLVCQRCLREFDWPVRADTLLVLARDEREMSELDRATMHEVVAADEPLSPLAMVEDELLLTLPYSPRHADDAQCAAAGARS